MRNWLTQLWRLKNLSDRLSANQKPRKASGVILSESKGFRNRGPNNINPVPRAGKDEMRFPSSTNIIGKKRWISPP